MPRNGSGVYSLPPGTTVSPGTTIESQPYNSANSDIASALTDSLSRTGDGGMQADLAMGGNKITGMEDGSAATDGATVGQTSGGAAQTAEVTVASATTCDVLAAASSFVAISGTTTITSLGTGTNRLRYVRFTGILTLTHNATSLILPGAANIVTAAGDVMILTSDGSSNVRVWSYVPAASATTLGLAPLTVASATTCDILGANSPLVSISGTTTITSFGTGTYRVRFVTFTGAMLLTHNATSLILPAAANITTAAGDTCVVISDGSSNARVLGYQKASGLPITYPTVLFLGTPVASTSGSSIDFTGIPSGTKRVTVSLAGVSTNGTSLPLIQMGDSGGIEPTGYLGTSGVGGGGSFSATNPTTGFALNNGASAASVIHGSVTLTLLDSATNTWVASGALGLSDSAYAMTVSGSKSLSAVLDRVSVITANAFDAGKINILYE